MLMFFDIVPEGFPAGAQFFFNLAIAAIAGIILNAIIPGRDYEYGDPEPYRFDKEGI